MDNGEIWLILIVGTLLKNITGTLFEKNGKASMTIKAIKKSFSLFLGVMLISFFCWAEGESLLRDDHPDSHLVVKGDTLWDISSRFLNDPWMWPEIWHVNPQIANPHLIYPGDIVKLIYLEGGPRLTVKRGQAGRTVKLIPGSGDAKLQPSVHLLPLEDPIPAIPLDVIDAFLSGSRIVNPGELDNAAYVLQGDQHHVITGAGSRLYAKGNFDQGTAIYGFFRKGNVYRDPKTNELLGVQAIDIGTGKVKSSKDNIATIDVVRTTQEIRLGDRLLASTERRVETVFYPSSPDDDIDGVILDVEGGVTQIGAMNVIVLNKGERENLEPGNVLAIFQRGETIRDPLTGKPTKLPEERGGLAMVFVAFEKISYALVLSADRPLRVGDYVRNP